EQRESALLKADGIRLVDAKQRRVLAYVGIFLRKRHRVRGTDTDPAAHAAQESAARVGRRRRLGVENGTVEFAIVDHFGPEAMIDDRPAVLQKLSVDMFIDRRRGYARVDPHRDG